MRPGRPRKIRMKKQVQRKRYGRAKRGAGNPRQIAATIGRNRVRRSRGR